MKSFIVVFSDTECSVSCWQLAFSIFCPWPGGKRKTLPSLTVPCSAGLPAGIINSTLEICEPRLNKNLLIAPYVTMQYTNVIIMQFIEIKVCGGGGLCNKCDANFIIGESGIVAFSSQQHLW